MITDIPFNRWDGWSERRFRPNHFYQTYEWFTVLTSAWKDLSIAIRVIDDRLALPVFSRRMGPLVLEGAPLRGYFTPYGGFLGEGPNDSIDKYLAGDFNEFALPPRSVCDDGGGKMLKTIIIDLQKSGEEIWKAMRPETRNKVRKAMKADVKVVVCSGPEWVEPAYRIFTQTYQRQNLLPPASIDWFYRISERLVPDRVRVVTAVVDGTIAAYALVGFDERTAYYADGGLDRAYAHVCPSNIIQWEVIQWAIGRHLISYDMAGGNIDSIANFKAGFGGEVVPYQTKESTSSLLGTLAWRGYNICRPAIKRLGALMARR